MNSIQSLLHQKEYYRKVALALIDSAELEGRGLNEDEQKQMKDYEGKMRNMQETIEEKRKNGEEEEIEVRREETNQMGGRPIVGRYSGTPVTSKAQKKSYRGMFYGANTIALESGGFRSINDFLAIVHSGRADERLIKRSMVEGIPSLGGFMVPEEFGAFLMDKSIEEEIIRPRATVWPMLSDTKKIPAFDGADHSNGLLGGLSGEWLAEGQIAQKKKGKLRLLQLQAKKLACFSQASNELIADGMSFEEVLTNGLIKAVGWYMDYAFINGTGTGQPLGIINNPALITVIKGEAQGAATITYNNIVDMFSRLAPACFNNAVWLANPSVIPQLLTMTIAIGTGGAQIPVLREESGKFTLLGKEVFFTEKCPALGSKGDLILADLSQYTIGLRKEIALDRSNAPGWTEDMTDYRVIVRVDGQGTWDKPLTPKNGTTLSWAVALESR